MAAQIVYGGSVRCGMVHAGGRHPFVKCDEGLGIPTILAAPKLCPSTSNPSSSLDNVHDFAGSDRESASPNRKIT